MLKLAKTKSFLKEIKQFQDALDRIENEKAKLKIKGLISQLKSRVKMIDEQHFSYAGSMDPKRAKEAVEELTQLRFEIQKIIREATAS